ncbi:MAG: nucleotidyltransferase family protein [Candidatus Thermoplasmatota archaeon]
MKTVGEIKKILKQNEKELKEKYKIKEIMIFGSYVRNEQKKKSDIDILVDFYEIPDLLKFIEIERHIKKMLGVKVDLVPKPALRPELRDKILNEATTV